MSNTTSLPELAMALSQEKGIGLADAQNTVFAAAARASAPVHADTTQPAALAPIPGSGPCLLQHNTAALAERIWALTAKLKELEDHHASTAGEPTVSTGDAGEGPSLCQIAMSLAAERGIPLEEANNLVFAAARSASAA